MLAIVIIFSVGALATATPQAEKQHYSLDSAEEHFEGFMQEHNKQYATEIEKQMRFEIFKQNLITINQQNANSDHAVFGITRFADLTQQEFKMFNNLRLNDGDEDCTMIYDDNPIPGNPPTEFSWQSKNVVTDVKDQKQCGSCWAFSVIGNVEGQYAIKNGNLVSLSEQELVDCDKVDGACNGGLMARGMRQLIDIGGVMSEESYPYTAEMQQCVFKKDQAVATLTDCNHYNFTNEENLRKILFSVGPLSIGIYADPLQNYQGGILSVTDCAAEQVDHGVLLVGFGEDNNVPYWLVKNSWGETFGINGYFKLQRNENTCNILSYGAVNAIMT